MLLLFFRRLLPLRRLVLRLGENPFIFLDKNVVQHLFWVDRGLVFGRFLGTCENGGVQYSVGSYRFGISELVDGAEARQSCGVSILGRYRVLRALPI